MRRKGVIVAAIMLLSLAVTIAVGSVSAAAAGDEPAQKSAQLLVGSWDVTVTLLDPPPTIPATGRALATFNADGTSTETSNSPLAARDTAHGSWRRIGPNLFAVTRVWFRFNPQTGAYLGTQKLNATVRVEANGQTFAAASQSELRDVDGNLVVGGVRATAAGRRINPEPIPDRP